LDLFILVATVSDSLEVRINEAYRDYQPRFDARKLIHKLLSTVPGKYLGGLDCVVLTNEANLSRRDRVGKVWSRRRKRLKTDILGRYYPGTPSRRPYIELRVDKIVTGVTRSVMRIPLLREIAFGNVLFHEIGHHIHYTLRPEFNEKEDVADKWERKLSVRFLRHNYWYVFPFMFLAAKIYKLLGRTR
jgi:hypothetical protein